MSRSAVRFDVEVKKQFQCWPPSPLIMCPSLPAAPTISSFSSQLRCGKPDVINQWYHTAWFGDRISIFRTAVPVATRRYSTEKESCSSAGASAVAGEITLHITVLLHIDGWLSADRLYVIPSARAQRVTRAKRPMTKELHSSKTRRKLPTAKLILSSRCDRRAFFAGFLVAVFNQCNDDVSTAALLGIASASSSIFKWARGLLSAFSACGLGSSDRI